MFSEKRNIYSFTELFNGNDSIQGCFDIAVAKQNTPADFVGADFTAIHPVGERHERDAQTAGGFMPREILRVGFRLYGTQLLQLVAQGLPNHLRELVGSHAVQIDFLCHGSFGLMPQRKSFIKLIRNK